MVTAHLRTRARSHHMHDNALRDDFCWAVGFCFYSAITFADRHVGRYPVDRCRMAGTVVIFVGRWPGR